MRLNCVGSSVSRQNIRPFFSVTTLKMHQLMVAMYNNLNKNNNFRMFEQTLLTVWRQYTKSKFNRRFPLKLQINFVFCLLWSGVTRFLYSYRQTDSIQSFYRKKTHFNWATTIIDASIDSSQTIRSIGFFFFHSKHCVFFSLRVSFHLFCCCFFNVQSLDFFPFHFASFRIARLYHFWHLTDAFSSIFSHSSACLVSTIAISDSFSTCLA